MPELSDLRLNEPAGLPPPQPDHHALRASVIVVIAVVIVLGIYLAWRRPWKPTTTSPPAAAQQVRASDTPLAAEPGENIAVPPLDESDPLVRELVGKLSSHPKVAAWLATKNLIRNFAVVVANISEGHTPAKHLRALSPGAPFQASADTGSAYILPSTYARYDTYADAVAALDARGTARLYATLKPRIQEAYQELGYSANDVDDAMKRAIAELLGTPIVEGRVAVNHPSVSYTFADSRLESLSAAQKQFLRMGPRNMRLIQDKLREIAPALGIDRASLPPPSPSPR
jgi:hypothetical protein